MKSSSTFLPQNDTDITLRNIAKWDIGNTNFSTGCNALFLLHLFSKSCSVNEVLQCHISTWQIQTIGKIYLKARK